MFQIAYMELALFVLFCFMPVVSARPADTAVFIFAGFLVQDAVDDLNFVTAAFRTVLRQSINLSHVMLPIAKWFLLKSVSCQRYRYER